MFQLRDQTYKAFSILTVNVMPIGQTPSNPFIKKLFSEFVKM